MPGTIATNAALKLARSAAQSSRAKPYGTPRLGTVFLPASIVILSTHWLTTFLPVAATDAIGTPKPRSNLMPLFRGLAEASIKGKWKLLLPWL
jgi:hypothetical protein